ncbi:unnamed protein product [Candida verbasci]|uniref:Leucine-rich repeat-containing protein SOG2 n=1 Tax=Candida verbasci TaxID=1227364 RepID=A0A9W4TUH9_9ASCO|nr:unnamed protein product [Candida verbasci]
MIHLVSLLNDQLDNLKQFKTLKLNNLQVQLKISDVVDIIYRYLNSFDPPLKLEKLYLQNNKISEVPSNFYKIANDLTYIDLHQNLISYIPGDFFQKFENLQYLDLSSNKLSYLPDSILFLQKLIVLNIQDNSISYLSPHIGELKSLNLLDLANNPLIMPSNEVIKALQKQKSDLDWVKELKNYLVTNRVLIHSKIEESKHNLNEEIIDHQQYQHQMKRSQSLSEGEKKSSKASRRMGLIIKKSDGKDDSEYNSNSKSAIVPSTLNLDELPHSASAIETSFKISGSPPPLPIQTTTISTGKIPINLQPTTATTKNSRQRSNTMKELDKILEKSDSVDTERKSSAYFKRLSTLQELPQDEKEDSLYDYTNDSSTNITTPRVQRSLDPGLKQKPQVTQSKSNLSMTSQSQSQSQPAQIEGGSPTRTNTKKHSNSTIIKVSRKVLFLFSELHSSIRRFTTFCSDKKVTIKMVSFLYTTKSNIDSLVENLEVMEDSGSNSNQIIHSLRICIGSFRSIMELLHENISTFVNNIDVCFIRMLYLSVYGSFNELHNAFSILCPPKETPKKINTLGMPTASTFESNEEVDEKLYETIQTATNQTQIILTELNNLVTKKANATNVTVPPIKLRDLTNASTSTLEVIKRLNTKLITIRNNPSQTTKKLFADDMNQFIKLIIATLTSVKAIVQDIPIIEEVRPSMSNLTKTTKEVTYYLGISSYRSLIPESAAQQPSFLSNSNSNVSNLFTPIQAHAPTLPQTATFNNGPTPIRNPMNINPTTTNSSTTSSTSHISQDVKNPHIPHSAPLTAPPQSIGQMYAKNGVNPFDGLIMAKNEKE